MIASAHAAMAGHRLSTAHLQSAYPFVAEGALGGRGAYIGRDQYGASFCYDPFELYRRGAITSPNAIVVGEIGSAKSSLAKTFLYRQVGVFGRRGWVIDPKGEYAAALRGAGDAADPPLAGRSRAPESALGALVRGGTARGAPRRLRRGALARALSPEEQAGCREALRAGSRHGEASRRCRRSWRRCTSPRRPPRSGFTRLPPRLRRLRGSRRSRSTRSAAARSPACSTARRARGSTCRRGWSCSTSPRCTGSRRSGS